MLGTKYPHSTLHSSSIHTCINRYNIEPFFWSSSLNWIPSRFQEEIKDKVGDREFCSEVLDHLDLVINVLVDITITLTFLRSMSDRDAFQLADNQSTDPYEVSTLWGSQKIDTRSPLILHSSLFLIRVLSPYLIFSHSDFNCRPTSPNFGSSVCTPCPKYQW